MQTAICCIAKCENRYLEEWVDYHLSLGVDRIFIYDNNDVSGERILPSVAGNERVTIMDCRGKTSYQNVAYTEFYKRYGKEYDWIAYIDVDEFITFSPESGLHGIHEFLSRFDADVDIVHLNWMCFGDNDICELDDDYSVLRRFVKPLDFDKCIQYDFPENNHVKSIIRGGLDIGDKMITVHTPKDLEVCVVDARGQECANDYFKPYDFSVAYIRHFVTKTIVEWLVKKSRGRVAVASSSEYYSFDRFFLYNDRTPEKEKVVKDYLFFKEAIELSVNTDLAISREALRKAERENGRLKKDLDSAVHSKAYRLGKILVSPFNWIKRKRVGKSK